MKHLLIAAALAALSSLAHATYCEDGSLIASHPNGDCSKTNTPPTSSTSKSKAKADSHSAAAALSGSKSSATGGAGGAGGNSTSSATGGAAGDSSSSNSLGSVGNDNSATSVRAYAIALPAPASTPALPMACPHSEITQSSRSIGWGFVSWADGHTDPRDCTLITLHNGMIQECQFASAAQLKAQLVRRYLPDFHDSAAILIDMTPGECTVFRNPLPPAPKLPEIREVYVPFTAPAPACVAVRSVHKRKPVPSCK